jgi:hypothetical protein
MRKTGELLDHALRDRRREKRISPGNSADRGEELFGRVVLRTNRLAPARSAS